MNAIPSALQAIVDTTLAALARDGIRGTVQTRWSQDGQHLFLGFVPARDLDRRIRGAEATGNNAIRYALIDAGYHADDPSGVVRVWLPRAVDPAATLDEAMEQRCRDGLAHLADSPMPIVSAKVPHPSVEPIPSTEEEQRAECKRLFDGQMDLAACDRIVAICGVSSAAIRRKCAVSFEYRGMNNWAERARNAGRQAA